MQTENIKKYTLLFYKVVRAQTERFRKSAIPSMIKMLNDCQKRKKDTFKKLDAMPVNHV